MKNLKVILIVLIIGLAASNSFGQGVMDLLDRLEKVEKQLNWHKSELAKLQKQLQNQPEVSSQDMTIYDESLLEMVARIAELEEELRFATQRQNNMYADLSNKNFVPPVHHEEESSDWNSPGLEISGFLDFVSSYEGAAFENGNFNLGQAEIDVTKELSENIAIEVAIAYNNEDAVFELGAAIVDIHLFGSEGGHLRPLFQLKHSGIVVGQFDVPFGIDLNYYPSLDRKLITGPSIVGYTHDEWNDFGVQFYMDVNFANFVTYWVNGYESSFEITDLATATALSLSIGDEVDDTPLDVFGFRLGVSPTSLFEVGGSFAMGWNDEHKSEMSLFGIDGQLEWNNLIVKSEYIVHQKHKTLVPEDDKGFYAQALYSFGKPFATLRYGGTRFDGVSNWAESYTVGAGYVLAEGAEVRAEYLINDEGIPDNLSLQIAVGF